MERKTIGGFIAALRKANGMTQKELAERLNVSDKTVSRWECDEGAPDLSVIPVIAEIFGVTCDELLRGERRSPADREEAASEPDAPSQKGEKERRRIFRLHASKYKNRTLVAAGISAAGLIAAMICNFGFLRAYIGFWIGTVFYLASIICQAVFVNNAFFSVSDDGPADPEIGRFKYTVIRLAERSVGLTVTLLGLSLPLLLLTGDAYAGLTAGSWLPTALITGLIALLITCVVCYFLNAALLKKGVYTLGEKETEIYNTNHALLEKHAIRFAAVWAVTLLVHISVTEIWSAWDLAPYTEFTDYETFVAYMETEEPRLYYDGSTVVQAMPIPGQTFYDENGNEISEEEAFTEYLTDKDGNILCQYVRRNENVAHLRTGGDDLLPIRVSTYFDLRIGQQRMNLIHASFGILYIAETAAAVILYNRKRAR